jgi:adenylate cyclase
LKPLIGLKFVTGSKIARGAAMGAIAAAVAVVLWAAGTLDRWEYVTWAWRVELFAKPAAATDKIKIILLDQGSLDWGQKQNGWSWPWPREVYSAIIDFCKHNEVRAVIFDVLYTESSVYGVADDQAFGNAIAGGPPFVAPLFLGKRSGSMETWPSDIPLRNVLRIENLDNWLAASPDRDIIMPKAAVPVMEVASNATMLANVTGEPDVDGIFRRGYLFRIFDGRAIPSLGLAPYLAVGASPSPNLTSPFENNRDEMQATDLAPPASGVETDARPSNRAESSRQDSPPSVKPPSPTARIEKGSLYVGDRKIPIDDDGKAILRFRGPSGTYETFSAAAVIQSEVNRQAGLESVIQTPSHFNGSYVFFGFSAPGLFDLRPIPISNVYPGVEIYATMLDNVLSNDFLREAPESIVVLAALLFALAGGISVARCNKVWHSTVCFVLLLPAPGLMGFAAYNWGYWWPVVFPEIAAAIALVAAVALNYATEGRQKAFIKKAFKFYLSPAVIEKILDDPSHLKLGGERRELTIFFSDLEGFSSISERLDPQALTRLLNDYLSDMTDIILEEGGTLDKYEGDAIIAFWNAPLPQPDHALRACRAAIRCQMKLQERRNEFMQRTGELMRARIGINTGEVVVGNMGSRSRFDYTVLGDAANLASRLEGANKAFGTSIMISEATFLQTSNTFVSREIGLLRVMGRAAPVRVYELVALAGEMDGRELEEFLTGLALCRASLWGEALQVFERLPGDPVASVYSGRCRDLLSDSVGSWDGVWNLSTK